MKCNLKTKELKAALKLYRLTTTSKHAFILSGIRLELKDDSFQIHSTDLENSILSKLDCESYESDTKNSILVPYKSFKNIVDSHDEEDINLELLQRDYIKDVGETVKEAYYDEDTQKWIQAITRVKQVNMTEYKLKVDKFKLETLDEEEFPTFPELDKKSITTEIDWSLFIQTLDKMKNFTSKDETRVILISFHCNCEDSCIVATDSYKLAKLHFDFECNGKFNLPDTAYKLLKDLKAERANLSFDESNIHFTIGNYTIVTRNIHGRFPEYDKLIPESSTYQLSFKSEDMIKRLNKLAKVFNEPGMPVKLSFFNNEVKLEMTLKEIGTYEDAMPCDITPALKEPLKTAFNPLFLKQCIEHFGLTTMHMDNSLRPAIIKENNDELYLIMSVRVEE